MVNRSQCSKNLQETIVSLESKNVLFIAAAGNSRSDISTFPEYPAAFRSVAQITVGASTPEFLRAGFSNYGKKTVHLGAPGVNILSTTGGAYDSWSGTSMATPHVTGVAALVAGNLY